MKQSAKPSAAAALELRTRYGGCLEVIRFGNDSPERVGDEHRAAQGTERRRSS